MGAEDSDVEIAETAKAGRAIVGMDKSLVAITRVVVLLAMAGVVRVGAGTAGIAVRIGAGTVGVELAKAAVARTEMVLVGVALGLTSVLSMTLRSGLVKIISGSASRLP